MRQFLADYRIKARASCRQKRKWLPCRRQRTPMRFCWDYWCCKGFHRYKLRTDYPAISGSVGLTCTCSIILSVHWGSIVAQALHGRRIRERTCTFLHETLNTESIDKQMSGSTLLNMHTSERAIARAEGLSSGLLFCTKTLTFIPIIFLKLSVKSQYTHSLIRSLTHCLLIYSEASYWVSRLFI